MLDLAFIRNNPDIVKEAARVKNNTLDIDHLLEVDRQVLALQRQVEEVRAEQNQISKRVQQAGKDKELRDTLIAQGKQLAEQIKALEPRLRELEDDLVKTVSCALLFAPRLLRETLEVTCEECRD